MIAKARQRTRLRRAARAPRPSPPLPVGARAMTSLVALSAKAVLLPLPHWGEGARRRVSGYSLARTVREERHSLARWAASSCSPAAE